jgi:hypothetical protein
MMSRLAGGQSKQQSDACYRRELRAPPRFTRLDP